MTVENNVRADRAFLFSQTPRHKGKGSEWVHLSFTSVVIFYSLHLSVQLNGPLTTMGPLKGHKSWNCLNIYLEVFVLIVITQCRRAWATWEYGDHSSHDVQIKTVICDYLRDTFQSKVAFNNKSKPTFYCY